jgi:hypothetical protein
LSLSLPVVCQNNPCDPFCQNFIEVPEAGFTADAGNSFIWSGGIISDQPQTILNRGLVEPCHTGADCQLNTHCTNVATAGGCGHGKCQTGTALAASCDPCVASICSAYPTCCRQSACAPGQVQSSDGSRCYFLGNAAIDWSSARAECQAYGSGWDLASIGSSAEATQLANWYGAYTWTGLNDQTTEGTYQWASGEAVSYLQWASGEPTGVGENCALLEPYSGKFFDEDCANAFAPICEGPGSPPLLCAHPPCSTGAALSASCDPCVAQICAQNSACCSSNWDSSCVALVASVCGQTCGCASDEVLGSNGNCYYFNATADTWSGARSQCQARGLDLASIDSATEDSFIAGKISASSWIGLTDQAAEGQFVWASGQANTYTNWNGGEPNNKFGVENCGEIYTSGLWNDVDCTDALYSVCEGPQHRPIGWTQSCVNQVESLCHASCGSNGTGNCVPWAPGTTDTACSGIDLAVGPACDGAVPVCNHGTADAPSGVSLVHFADGSGQYPSTNPNLAGATTCTVPVPIPAGRCISVTNCAGLTGSREIMVNPPGSSNVTECSLMDNWGLSSSGVTCKTPLCSQNVAQSGPMNMVLMVDTAGTKGSRFGGIQQAVMGMAANAAYAGVGVALRFYPVAQPGSGCDSACNVTACSNMQVPLGALTADPAPTDAQEQALSTAFGTVTNPEFGGSEPVEAALRGALQVAIAHAQAFPNDGNAVVLFTSRLPDTCDTNMTNIAAIAQNAYATYGILTYVIDMNRNNVSYNPVALAGGSGAAVNGLAAGTASGSIAGVIQPVLEGIAAQGGLNCTFTLQSSNIDTAQTVVTMTSSTGTVTTLTQQANMAGCGDGWFLDNPTTPTTLTICPTTCATARADRGSSIRVAAPCLASYGPITFTELYQSQCGSGTEVQWGFMAYDSLTPADSNIVFRIRTATSVADLPNQSFLSLATASTASPTGSVCKMSGPPPCPADLYTTLGGLPAVRGPVLELEVTLNPSSTSTQTPVLNNWQISYSCPPAE